MSEDRGTPGPRSASGASALALGAVWLCVESTDAWLAGRAPDAGSVLRSLLVALPWQLGFFGILAAPAIALRLRWRVSGSWVLGAATLIFFLSRVGEGLLKDEGRGIVNAAAWIAAGIALSGVPAIFLGVERWLAGRWRAAFVPALWLGWILVLVPALARSSPALGFARVPQASTVFDPVGWLFALAVLLTTLSIARWPRLWPAAVVLLAVRWLGASVEAPTSGADAPTASRPDVVVIVVDTFRADLLSGDGRSPVLDAFLDESIVFERAISPANQTLMAMPGVMTSLSVHSVGSPMSRDARTMAEHLQDAGFSTAAVAANPLINERTGYAQGFDRFSDASDWLSHQIDDLRRILGVVAPSFAYRLGISSSRLYYRPASEIRTRAVRMAAEASRPMFLYVHTMDMHGPYLPPRRLLEDDYDDGEFLSYFSFLRVDRQEAMQPDERLASGIENLRQRYDGELAFTDEQLGRLIEALRAAGRWEESLVWLISDHGESFGERGFAGHGGANTTPSVQRVPMALKLPASWEWPARVVDATVSTFDVLPTTLSLLDLPPPVPTHGTDLTPWIRGGEGRREVAVVSLAGGLRSRILSCFDWPWQLDVVRSVEGVIERRTLYNLEIDPEQRVDLSRAHPKVVKRLERELAEFSRRERQAMIRTRREQFDAKTLEQLRRLGYIE